MSLVQLPRTSAPEPLPSMSSCDFEGGRGGGVSDFADYISISFFESVSWLAAILCPLVQLANSSSIG